MDWLFDLHRTNPSAQAIAILSLVCVAGMSLGSVEMRGVKLGTSGVLFAALVVGHFSKPIDLHTLEFVKELGLILFVFCMGLQLGPGFFASLRRSGLRLNLLATTVVLLGALSTALLGSLLRFDPAASLGIFSGATTNTPSLGAAQQTLASLPGVSVDRATLPALSYAVTYPAGIIGIIGTILALKRLFGVDVGSEVTAHAATAQSSTQPLERRTLEIQNPSLSGVTINQIAELTEAGVVVSRIRHSESKNVTTVGSSTVLKLGDHILAVGPARGLDQVQRIVGEPTSDDLLGASSALDTRQVILTTKDLLGKTIAELEVPEGVLATRITRGDLEFAAVPTTRLKFGDVLQVVGPSEAIDLAAKRLGNSLHALNETQFVPLFAGISLGIAIGTFPIHVPGLPQPVRLGLAGGPLIVAILVGRLGQIGRLVWYMPRTANVAFREFGIALFFASVGLLAGPRFFSTVCSSVGILWLMAGVCVTVLPLLLVGVFARWVWRLNFVDLAGLLAGSMTDPPALAFANGVCRSESPCAAYATVYPLTMLLRVTAAQVLAVTLCG